MPNLDDAQLNTAIAKDIAKASQRLQNCLCNAADDRTMEGLAEYALSARKSEFLKVRYVGKKVAAELQGILEDHGVAAWYLLKVPRYYETLPDAKAQAMLMRLARGRSKKEILVLLDQALYDLEEGA